MKLEEHKRGAGIHGLRGIGTFKTGFAIKKGQGWTSTSVCTIHALPPIYSLPLTSPVMHRKLIHLKFPVAKKKSLRCDGDAPSLAWKYVMSKHFLKILLIPLRQQQWDETIHGTFDYFLGPKLIFSSCGFEWEVTGMIWKPPKRPGLTLCWSRYTGTSRYLL